MSRFFVALLLLMLGLGANAALYLREPAQPRLPEGNARVELAGLALVVPRALIRDPAQLAGGRLLRLDLAMAIKDFSPLPPISPQRPDAPMPDRLSIMMSNPGNTPAAQEHFALVYARFLAPETQTRPDGLVLRRFRAGTPYDDRILYMGAGTGKLFIALCPKPEIGPKPSIETAEPCLATIRQDDVEAELRFEQRYLPEWRRLSLETSRMISGWRGKPVG